MNKRTKSIVWSIVVLFFILVVVGTVQFIFSHSN